MAKLKVNSEEYIFCQKMLKNLRESLKKYEEEKNYEWIYRTEIRIAFYEDKLNGQA